MKKIALCLLIIILTFVVAPVSLASSKSLKNYQIYRIYGRNYEDVDKELTKYIQNAGVKSQQITKIKNAYYDSKNNKHFYVKFYPAYKNTDLFVVADFEYSPYNNHLTKSLDALSYRYSVVKDKEATKEYTDDFIYYARQGYFKGFFVLPDYLTSVKKGLGQANDYVNQKKEGQKAALPYKNEEVYVDLTCIDSKSVDNTDAQISIKAKEYRLKYKENKYVHGFEYIIFNNSDDDLFLKSVKGKGIANLIDVEATSLVDLDRIDALSWTAVFPPLLIASLGTSLILKVPAWYRNVRVAEETARYTNALPENYRIPPQGHIRVFVLQYKLKTNVLDYVFEKNDVTYNISL